MNYSVLHDQRNNCFSVIIDEPIGNYVSKIEEVYRNRGGIEGQRAALKTKTGIEIRKRMVSDIIKGTVLPPIVIGIILNSEDINELNSDIIDDENLNKILEKCTLDNISIIDGMQRTTAIFDALKTAQTLVSTKIRIEYWIATSVNSLIYRMLVLNTGQVPWDVKRQLETIYRPILNKIKEEVEDVSVLNIDQNERRSTATEYQSHRIIELFLVFSARKPHINLKDEITDQFARLDTIEATSDDHFLTNFIAIAAYLVKLDQILSRITTAPSLDGKFKQGIDIFTAAPASIGFVAACSELIYGPSVLPINSNHSISLESIKANLQILLDKLSSMNEDQLINFIDFNTLNQLIDVKSSKVGEYQRDLFFKAFKMMVQHSAVLQDMSGCWRSN